MKTRSFSIFLLKAGYNAQNSLKPDHQLLDDFQAQNLPQGASLFVSDRFKTTPWWVNYFSIDGDLEQESKGALIFLPVRDRYFALTFGHIYHNLLDVSYEYDFGIVTMKTYRSKLHTGNLTLLEHQDSKWLPIEELDILEWAPVDIPAVKCLQQK